MLLSKVKAKNNVKLDFFHLEETDASNPDIFATRRYKPTLNNYSRFLVTFDDATTTAGGIADIALGYTFSIYREIEDANQLVYVARLKDGSLSRTDYNVVHGTRYRYYVFKEDESAISEAVVSNDVETCWWDWSLTDIIPSEEDGLYYANPNNVWHFNLNVESAARTQTMNTTVYDNLGQYPKVSIGSLNYATGSLTCLLGNIEKTNTKPFDYVEPAVLLDEWNAFCANGHLKLLKDRKGNAMIVVINSNSTDVDDVTREQVNTVTFGWVQVDDVHNIAVIGER